MPGSLEASDNKTGFDMGCVSERSPYYPAAEVINRYDELLKDIPVYRSLTRIFKTSS